MSAYVLPFSEVNKECFRELIRVLIGPLQIRNRPFFVQLLKNKYKITQSNLLFQLEIVQHVSTTADCWTAKNRSFLGMTVH